MITITESAKIKIADILLEDGSKYVRAFVQGGGCSGMQYGFTIEDSLNEDDFQFDNVVVDSMSMQYLTNATIDYKEDINGSQFSIKNPNAVTTCGCGSSFSPE
jgi:iron-sulfur cluster insertion protein